MTFVFVDGLLELGDPEMARFSKCCSLSEDFYMQHFPGSPVLPGALLLESFVQSATLFLAWAGNFRRWPIVRGVSHARFLSFVQPGDRLELVIERTGDGSVGATARREGERVASAKLEFDLVDTEDERNQSFRDSLSAAREFLQMLGASL